jgi:HSP20 family molecular chaperone IbpA
MISIRVDKMKNNSKEIVFELNLPEYKWEEIEVKLYKTSLIVRAEKKETNKMQKPDFFHAEKIHKKFKYATTLPKIDPTNAKITFRKGKLLIIAPKIFD